MTNRIRGARAVLPTLRSLSVGLVLAAALSGVPPLPAAAATIHAHAHLQHTPRVHHSAAELARLRKMVDQWKTDLASLSPGKLFHGLLPNHSNDTPKHPSTAQILAWRKAHPALALATTQAAGASAPVLAHQAQISSQNQAAHLNATISTPSKSAAYQVLVPPTSGTVAAPQILVPQVMPVPEPSSAVSALALVGIAGGWWRLRRTRSPS